MRAVILLMMERFPLGRRQTTGVLANIGDC